MQKSRDYNCTFIEVVQPYKWPFPNGSVWGSNNSFNTRMHILQLADLTLCHCLPHYKWSDSKWFVNHHDYRTRVDTILGHCLSALEKLTSGLFTFQKKKGFCIKCNVYVQNPYEINMNSSCLVSLAFLCRLMYRLYHESNEFHPCVKCAFSPH